MQDGPDKNADRQGPEGDGDTGGAVPGTGTVGKALAVLDLVAAAGRPLRFAELQTLSDQPKATLYRLVQTLRREGVLEQTADGAYVPGLRLMRLAHVAWARSSLAQVARPHLDRLSAELSETVHLAQLDHGQVLYVGKRNAARTVEMFSAAGKIGPAYCTGVGKVLLAYLPPETLEAVLPQQSFHRFTANTLVSAEDLRRELAAIRAAGAGFDDEEHEPGIICAAVPVLARSGRGLAALSATTTTAARSLDDLKTLVPRLQAVAAAIAADMDASGYPEASVPVGPQERNGQPSERPATTPGPSGPAGREGNADHVGS